MSRFKDITGGIFNDLTAVRFLHFQRPDGAIWEWMCICGKSVVASAAVVKCGDRRSCGCRKTRHSNVPKICHICKETSTRRNKNGHICTVCHKCYNAKIRNYRTRKPEVIMLISARKRAKDEGLPFDLSLTDLVVPARCPVFGFEMKFGPFSERDTSPSIDRIVPELGYVKGNIAIISFRANRFKNDASAEELRKIADWMDSVAPKIHAVA